MDHGPGSDDTVEFPLDADPAEFSGERYLPGVKGQLRFEHLHRYLLAHSLAAGRDVLDVACGEGYGAAALARVARSVTAVDIDAATVEGARGRYAALPIAFQAGSIERLPCPDASFDLAVCFETIEHVGDAGQALTELRRVLRPDGLLVISTPDAQAEDGAAHGNNPFHTREFSIPEFRALLAAHFPLVSLCEQRFLHGSLIAEREGVADSPRVAHGSQDDRLYHRATNGLGSSYTIALASAAPLPAVGVSILDAEFELRRIVDDLRHAVGRMHALEHENRDLQHRLRLREIQLEGMRRRQAG